MRKWARHEVCTARRHGTSGGVSESRRASLQGIKWGRWDGPRASHRSISCATLLEVKAKKLLPLKRIHREVDVSQLRWTVWNESEPDNKIETSWGRSELGHSRESKWHDKSEWECYHTWRNIATRHSIQNKHNLLPNYNLSHSEVEFELYEGDLIQPCPLSAKVCFQKLHQGTRWPNQQSRQGNESILSRVWCERKAKTQNKDKFIWHEYLWKL